MSERPGLPTDWSRRRILGCAAAGHLLLLPVALRHDFFWGGRGSLLGLPVAEWLHLAEALGLLAFVLLAGSSFSAAVRQAPSLPLRWLLGGGILLAGLAALAPPFLSQDVFDYAARSLVEALTGENPYLVPAAAAGDHPALVEARQWARWEEWVQPYGPLTTLLQWLVGQLGSFWAVVYGLKLAFAGCHVGMSWLVYRALQVQGEGTARQGLVLLLWNPWLLLEAAGSGHNDAFMVLFLAAAALAVVRDRIGLATFAFGLAVLAKHGCAPIGPLLLAYAWHRRRLAAFGLGVLATAAVAAPLAIHYFPSSEALRFLTTQVGIAAATPAALLGDLVGAWSATAVQALGALLVLWILLRSLPLTRTPAVLGHRSVLVLVVFLLLFMANFAPWYHLWWLALLGLCRAPILTRVAELLGWVGPLSYLVFLGTRSYGRLHELWQFALALLWPALLILLERRQLLEVEPSKADESRPAAG